MSRRMVHRYVGYGHNRMAETVQTVLLFVAGVAVLFFLGWLLLWRYDGPDHPLMGL